MDIVHEILHGGLVMVPLLCGSVIVVAVIFERIWFFSRLQWGGSKFRDRLLSLVRQGKVDEALRWVADQKGPIPAMVAAALMRWRSGRAPIEGGMGLEARGAQETLYRSIPILETAVTASPLVGLLGTILGMMGVFHVVAERIAANPNADTNGITAGIGEALISTAAGIFLAVLSLLANNLFVRLAELQMERADIIGATLLLIYDESHADEVTRHHRDEHLSEAVRRSGAPEV